jgi:PIN domain nuclease of toxin-antitoxin system
MIYIDTHVALWLYEGYTDKFTKKGLSLLENNQILISAMAVLELELLHEIKRSKVSANKIISELEKQIGLQICDTKLTNIIKHAIELNWTRDPFDRLIVANSILSKHQLLTKDSSIQKSCELAVW